VETIGKLGTMSIAVTSNWNIAKKGWGGEDSFSETSLLTKATSHHITEDVTLHSHGHDNHKSPKWRQTFDVTLRLVCASRYRTSSKNFREHQDHSCCGVEQNNPATSFSPFFWMHTGTSLLAQISALLRSGLNL
jgi:hypothetical protein